MSTVWVDLDNAPHVPFFAPLIGGLQQRGHETLVTVRDYGYTQEMIEQRNIPYTLIGRHAGKHPVKKVTGLAARVLALVKWARGKRIDVAVSHGSRALVGACAVLRIPCVTMYDYEFVSTVLFNRLSRKVLLPDMLSDELVESFGLGPGRVVKYPGMKEEVYLADFSPDRSILDELQVDDSAVLVILRPPATAAHYHNPVSEEIVQAAFERISKEKNVFGVVLPRTAAQARELGESLRDVGNIRVLTRPVNGLNLLWHSDLVVGGGGTMNREAAMLGVPVYSVFMGKVGAIDKALSEQGKLVLVRDTSAVSSIKFEKRVRLDPAQLSVRWQQRSDELVGFMCDEILAIAKT